MRLAVVVVDVRQILARHVQQVRRVVVADREDDVPGVPDAADSARRARLDGKHRRRLGGRFAARLQLALDREHRLLERDLQVERLDDLAVVLQRFGARRLLERRDERQPADLEQLGRREEHHLRRKIEDRIDEHALLDHLVVEPTLLGGDGGGEPRRSRADDEEIANGHLSMIIRFPSRPGAGGVMRAIRPRVGPTEGLLDTRRRFTADCRRRPRGGVVRAADRRAGRCQVAAARSPERDHPTL